MERIEFGVWLQGQLVSYPTPHTFFHALRYNLKELNFEDIRDASIKAEKLGYHSLWIADHLSWEKRRQKLEPWIILSALSSITNRIRLGTMVLCNLYRHPGLAAKMSSIFDFISGGRLEYGIGAGWNEVECENFGIDFPEPWIRLGMLRESVEITKKLWTQERTTYIGKYYTIIDAYCEPKPVQKPHPPILIGGSGEKLTLKIVARHADRSNFSGSPEVIKRKLDVLRKHCTRMGRDYNSIVKTTNLAVVIAATREEYGVDMRKRFQAEGSPGSFKEWLKKAEMFYITGTPEECVEKINQYVSLGIKMFILRFGKTPETDDLELFAKEVIPRINK